MILQHKNISGSVDDVDSKSRRVTGYLSSFGNKDFDGDIIVKGAYAKTLKERRDQILFLHQHNWDTPFGGFDELEEDEKGLRFVSAPFVKGVSFHEDALKLYEAGVYKEHSVGFITVKAENEEETRTRYIKEIKLYEGSVVTIGANDQTPFTGFKTGMKEIQERTSAIMKAIRTGNFTDKTFLQLEIALKQLEREAYKLGKDHSEEPSNDTPDKYEPISKAIDNFLINNL